MNLVLLRDLMHELMTFVEFYELVHRHDMQSTPSKDGKVFKKQEEDNDDGQGAAQQEN